MSWHFVASFSGWKPGDDELGTGREIAVISGEGGTLELAVGDGQLCYGWQSADRIRLFRSDARRLALRILLATE